MNSEFAPINISAFDWDLLQRRVSALEFKLGLLTGRDLRLDKLGEIVREAWIDWASVQENPKPSWLVPYSELSEEDKAADRMIGERVARYVIHGEVEHE